MPTTNLAQSTAYNKCWRDEPLVSPRVGFGKGILAAGKRCKDLIALCADLTDSIKLSEFQKHLPEQFLQIGVAEQNMIGIAAGLALSGKIPFTASYAAFTPGRTWDQIRISAAYSLANVKIIGSHAGVNVGPDGATHQMLEDIAIMRVLPNMVVLSPTDAVEAEKMVQAMVKYVGPVYMRLGRDNFPVITSSSTIFHIGKAYLLEAGFDITIFATGLMVSEALLARDQLLKENISAEVISIPTIKPLDSQTILESLKKTGAGVVAEEAQVFGGLGSAISELVSENLPVPLQFVGVKDVFTQSGTSSELIEFYELKAHNIVVAAKKALAKKR